jgi:hypothetical protein
MEESETDPVREAVEEIDPENPQPERPRGILSQADREFLRGEKEFGWEQSASNARGRIRERVAAAFRDFQLLETLEDRDREMVFDELSPGEVAACTADLVEFVYRGVEFDADAVEQMVARGIYNGAIDPPQSEHSGRVSDVAVSIEIDREPNVEEVYERYEREGWAQLTNAELGLLLRRGKLDQDDLDLEGDLPPVQTLSPADEGDDEG